MLPVERPRVPLALGLILLVLAPSPPAPSPPTQLSTPERHDRVWLRPAHRRQITTAPVEQVPESAVLLLDGRRVYFVDEGEGWFRPRGAETPVAPGERVVTEGAFLIKSERAR